MHTWNFVFLGHINPSIQEDNPEQDASGSDLGYLAIEAETQEQAKLQASNVQVSEIWWDCEEPSWISSWSIQDCYMDMSKEVVVREIYQFTKGKLYTRDSQFTDVTAQTHYMTIGDHFLVIEIIHDLTRDVDPFSEINQKEDDAFLVKVLTPNRVGFIPCWHLSRCPGVIHYNPLIQQHTLGV